MAVSPDAYAVINMTMVSGDISLIFFRRSIPPTFGIFRSVITRSNFCLLHKSIAVLPLAAETTSYPSLSNKISRNSLMLLSSSTTSILDTYDLPPILTLLSSYRHNLKTFIREMPVKTEGPDALVLPHGNETYAIHKA